MSCMLSVKRLHSGYGYSVYENWILPVIDIVKRLHPNLKISVEFEDFVGYISWVGVLTNEKSYIRHLRKTKSKLYKDDIDYADGSEYNMMTVKEWLDYLSDKKNFI